MREQLNWEAGGIHHFARPRAGADVEHVGAGSVGPISGANAGQSLSQVVLGQEKGTGAIQGVWFIAA